MKIIASRYTTHLIASVLFGACVLGPDMAASQTVPVGTVKAFAGTLLPYGWAVADGSAVSRAQYPALFEAIGTTYGAGDGSTTFNLPVSAPVPVFRGHRNYRLRMPFAITSSGHICAFEIRLKTRDGWLKNSMTGNSSGSVGDFKAKVSASSEYHPIHAAWKAFNGDKTYTDTWCTAAGNYSFNVDVSGNSEGWFPENKPTWVMIDFGADVALTGYQVYSGYYANGWSYMPQVIKLEYSDDGILWKSIEGSTTVVGDGTEAFFGTAQAEFPLTAYAVGIHAVKAF